MEEQAETKAATSSPSPGSGKFTGGWVVGVLRDEFAHDGELEDGLAQFGDVLSY